MANTKGNLTVAGRVSSNVAHNPGTWVTGTEYLQDDLVFEGGILYQCLTGHTASALFSTDTANWLSYQDSGLLNTGAGTPSTDSTVSAYRTGLLGIGETNPAELLDMLGTSATGGIKMQYTYDNGRIVRVQEGGQNILSELGVPANAVEGYAVDILSIPNYTNTRSYILNGDFSAVAGGRNLQNGMGISSLTSNFFTRLQFEPAVDDDTSNWVGRFQALNANNDSADISIRTAGTGGDFTNEAQAKIVISNTEGDATNFIQSPHMFNFNELIRFGDYASGTFVTGYTHSDDLAKTGTAATVIGTTQVFLGVDSNGVMHRTNTLDIINLTPQAAEPAGVAGDIYFNSTTNKHRGHDGTTWNDLY